MSLEETKQHLIQLLDDVDNKVIALSGKWGTGKSHLWQEVKAATTNSAASGAVYVSLFGMADMNQVKFKAVQSAIPKSEDHPAALEKVRTAFKGAKKVMEAFHKGFAALDDLALLAVPSVLSDKVIVLDDIERKHDKLSIEEVLGFIDEFTQQHRSRFVLILNDDQLARRDVWDTLREKVIDQEIRLLTTPEEAFGIAIKLTPSAYADWIKRAVMTCSVNNIRIIRKVIKAANRILGGRVLDESVLARVVPSIVLLAAINFKGIEDGPDFQFVLAAGSEADWSEFLGDRNKEPDEEGKRKGKWRLLLDELGIKGCDEFEALVVDFLESGQFELDAVSTIIERYAKETETLRVREQANEFIKRLAWDHRLSEKELVEQAKGLIPVAKHLDPYIVTDIQLDLASLPGGLEVGEKIVHGWLNWFRSQKHEEISDENPFGKPLHADIKAAFDAINVNAQAKATVFEVCKHIVEHSGWGTRQEVAMKAATAADFESTIQSLDVDDLRFFMRRMLEMRRQRQTYDLHFGMATERFVDACRNIANAPDSNRLGSLVKRLFNDARMNAELASPTPIVAATEQATPNMPEQS